MGAHASRSAAATRTTLDSLRQIFQVIRESSRQAERVVGMTGAQVFVLRTIGESPRLSLNDLARHTRTHQSSVSVVVSGLLSRRLVRRVRASADARRAVITLTPRGRKLVARTPDLVQGRLIAAIDGLPERRRRALAAALEAVARAVATGDRHAPMFFHPPHRRRGRPE